MCIIHSNNDSQRHRCQEEGLHHSDMHVFLDLPVNHHWCKIFISKKTECIINHLSQQKDCLNVFSLLCLLGPTELVASSVQLVTWQQDTVPGFGNECA